MTPPDGLSAADKAVIKRTITVLGRDSDLSGSLQTLDGSASVPIVLVRAIVVRLRSAMMDATFDDTHVGGDIVEASDLYERWRRYLQRETD